MPIKTLGSFEIRRLEILNEGGEADLELAPALTPEDLRRVYRGMLLSRRVDERLVKLQRQGRIGTCGLCTGQEAVSAGVALAMQPRDWMVPAYREMAGMLMRGVPLLSFFLYWKGYEEGNRFPAELRTLPIEVIVGSQTLHAVGLAFAMRAKGEKDTAVVTFFGEGGTSQGETHEALNFASVWRLPVVFVCQNNQWAISTPRSKQTASRSLAQKALAYDMPGIQVDGNDVLAVYRSTREALEWARGGGGPTFIEAESYRLLMHTTADDPTRYRPESEVQAWWAKEPLLRLRRYMERAEIWTALQDSTLEEEIQQEIERAVVELEALGEVQPDAPFDHVYGTRHDLIERQRAEFLAEASRDEEIRHGHA